MPSVTRCQYALMVLSVVLPHLPRGQARTPTSSNATCQDWAITGGSTHIFAYYKDLGWNWFWPPCCIIAAAPFLACCAPVLYNCCIANNAERERQGLQKLSDNGKRDEHSFFLMKSVCAGSVAVAVSLFLILLALPFFAIPFLEKLNMYHLNRDVLICVPLPGRDSWNEVFFGYYLIWFYLIKWLVDLRYLCQGWRHPDEVAFTFPPTIFRCLSLLCAPCVWLAFCITDFLGRDVPDGQLTFYHTWIMQLLFHTYTEWAVVITLAGLPYWYLWLVAAIAASVVWMVLVCVENRAWSPVHALRSQLYAGFLPQIVLTVVIYFLDSPINDLVVYNFISKLLGCCRHIVLLCSKPADSDYVETDESDYDDDKESDMEFVE